MVQSFSPLAELMGVAAVYDRRAMDSIPAAGIFQICPSPLGSRRYAQGRRGPRKRVGWAAGCARKKARRFLCGLCCLSVSCGGREKGFWRCPTFA